MRDTPSVHAGGLGNGSILVSNGPGAHAIKVGRRPKETQTQRDGCDRGDRQEENAHDHEHAR
jgi:hypothetical protein